MAQVQPLPGCPRRPLVRNKTTNTVEIVWHTELFANSNRKIKAYELKKARKVSDNEWNEEEQKMEKNENVLSGQAVSCDIQLDPNSSYKFAVTALYSDGSFSALSEWSDVVSLNQDFQNVAVSLKDKAFELSTGVKDCNLVRQLKLTSIYMGESENIRKFEVGQKNGNVSNYEKVIMLVGATGAGKSTFINAMVNYLFDIKWDDDVRLRIIDDDTKADQANSNTEHITSYTINETKVNYSVTIIDTPGFADCGGLARDEKISEEMRMFFTSPAGCQHIDAVGIVIQAQFPRLTPTQGYIFDRILSIFGNDIEENIMVLCTFADENKPPALSVLRKAGLSLSDVYKFNNKGIYGGKTGTNWQINLNKMAWELSAEGYENFLRTIEKKPKNNLSLTKEVLKKRNNLEATIDSIRTEMTRGLSKLENLQMEMKIVKQMDKDILESRNHTTTHFEVEDLQEEHDTYSYNCTICNDTCSTGYGLTKKLILEYGRAIGKKVSSLLPNRNENPEKCSVCHCSKSDHEFSHNEKKKVKREIKKTNTEMERRHVNSKKTKLMKRKLIAGLKEEFEKIQANTTMLTEEVRKLIERLNEIALKPDATPSLQFIDMLILQEKVDALPGFFERVLELEDLRKKTEVFLDVVEEGTTLDLYAKYKNTVWWQQIIDLLARNHKDEKEENRMKTGLLNDNCEAHTPI